MKICSLSSGSKGNSLYIESEYARVLIDIGLSAQQIRQRLESIEVDPTEIDAIILTHAHRDHVRGAGVFSRQFQTPIYGHPDTLDEITYLFRKNEKTVPWYHPFQIKDLSFTPFPVSHDAIPTVGYLVSSGARVAALCTDLGVATPEVETHLRQADFLILESNHDPDMLINGPYPWDLKERIASRVGHLSNHDTGRLLKTLLNGRVEKVLLAHISEENNTPDLARETVLHYIGNGLEDLVDVIEQKKVSPLYIL